MAFKSRREEQNSIIVNFGLQALDLRFSKKIQSIFLPAILKDAMRCVCV